MTNIMYRIIASGLLLSFMSLQAFAQSRHKAGEFDYYTMALSWSPTYCDTRRNNKPEQQCDGQRPYAFVLHGLWPQYNRGWPSFCRARNRWVPNDIIKSMLDIMPSKRLIIHQWRKHGVCSGVDTKTFFELSRQAFNSIKIPERYTSPQNTILISPSDVENDFLKANPKLKADMISIQCGRGRRLREVRICFNRDLKLTPCGANENQRRLCRRDKIVMPPVR
ncbi:MAG: ribonuclease T2 [Pseudomonadota bacterium]